MALITRKPERALIAATRSGVSLPWSWSRPGRTVASESSISASSGSTRTATVSMRPEADLGEQAGPLRARHSGGCSGRTRGRHSRRRHQLPCPRSLGVRTPQIFTFTGTWQTFHGWGCRALNKRPGGATLCNSGAEVYRSATNRPQARKAPQSVGEAGAPRAGVEAFQLLLQAVGLAAPSRGLAGFHPRRFPPLALAEPGREPANDEPKGKRAEQEQEQRRLDAEAGIRPSNGSRPSIDRLAVDDGERHEQHAERHENQGERPVYAHGRSIGTRP